MARIPSFGVIFVSVLAVGVSEPTADIPSFTDGNLDPKAIGKDYPAEDMYDEIAQDYDETYKKKLGWDSIPDPLLQKFVNGSRAVLDVGCGPGTIARKLRRFNFDVQMDGFDVSQGMVDLAKQSGLYRKAYRHDLNLPIPCEAASYGALVTAGVLVFVSRPGMIADLAHCMEPSGIMIIYTRVDRFEEYGYGKEASRLVASGYLSEFLRSVAPFATVGDSADNYKGRPDLEYYSLVYRVERAPRKDEL